MPELRLVASNVVSLAAYREARQEETARAVLYPDHARWMDLAPSEPEPPRAA